MGALWFLCLLLGAAAEEAAAPLNGAPFKFARKLDFSNVEPRTGLKITKLKPPAADELPSGCHDGDQANKDKCLTTPGKGCMFTKVESDDPTLLVQATNSYCLPCELDGEDIPCWSVGSLYGNMVVKECTMSCSHQKRMQQPYHACSEGPGGVSESECFARGDGEVTKCMYLAYEDSNGQVQSQCGPCTLPGSGSWGCPAAGSKGADNTTIRHCASQCEKPCAGPPDCAPTITPPPVVAPNPGVARVASPPSQMLSAPTGGGAVDANPMAVVQAAILAAKAAGHPFTTPAPPKVYFPVVVYRTPADYMATTIPPMAAFQPLWPQAWPRASPVNWQEYSKQVSDEPGSSSFAQQQQARPLLAKKRLSGDLTSGAP